MDGLRAKYFSHAPRKLTIEKEEKINLLLRIQRLDIESWWKLVMSENNLMKLKVDNFSVGECRKGFITKLMFGVGINDFS
jgi:hypothetical protein